MKPAAYSERGARLERARSLKMARSAHAFVRGNTAQFYEWLAAEQRRIAVPDGPAVWICGDCHLGNLGPLADSDGNIEIEIRDLDQTVIGNPAHDMIRLALSLASAARGSDLPGVVTATMIEAMREGYVAALDDPDMGEAGPEPNVVKVVKRRALGRKWRHLAKERLQDVDPSIPLGKRFWPLSERERSALTEAARTADQLYRIVSQAETPEVPIELVDAAYWMKGCSSLGLLRIAAILAIGEGDKRKFALVDLKEATDPVAPATSGADMPGDPAERVVAGARALSPHLGSRIAATTLLGHSLFVRELMPQDLKLEVDQFSRKQAVAASRYLAFILGRAHARQLSCEERRDWRGAWMATGATLDAPSWFWRAVVDLAERHEGAYLDHCRRHALSAENR